MIQALMGLPKLCLDALTHLTTHLASARAAKIENLDAAISTRAPASTAMSNATWSDAKAGFIDMAISGVARIKSIQHSGVTISNTTTTGNVTISSVTTSKAFIIPAGQSGNGSSFDQVSAQLYFTSGTNVQASRSSSDSTMTYRFTVVEFY